MNDELRGLVDATLDGTLTPAERDRLEAILRDDPAARAFYVSYADLHASLRWPRRVGRASASVRIPLRHRFAGAAAAAVMLAALLFFLARPAPTQVTGLAGELWDERGRPLEAGSTVTAGVLDLTHGLAQLRTPDGAVLILEAPARFEISGRRRAFLHRGRLVARVPAEAVGYTIETPETSVIDLGTEFGLGVDLAGTTTVQVFQGSVINRLKGGAPEERLSAGESREIAKGVSEAVSKPMTFLRQLPPPDPGAWRLSYSKTVLDRVEALPARGSVTVDGDFADWDLSARFTGRTVEPYGKIFYLDGALMYDAQHLYVSAHIGDPAPMRSRIDPLLDPSSGWKGGGLQIRLSTSKDHGWPVRGEAGGLPGRAKEVGTRREDVSENLVHLTMWHFQPRAEACLHLAYGMDLHGERINPAAWKGAYRPDPDGRGYSLEYAIPWALLNRKGPPAPGDPLGCCFVVNWSDAEGLLWKGQLTEITNPAERGHRGNEGQTFSRAALWGRLQIR